MPIPNQAWQSLIYAGPNEQQEIESGDGGVSNDCDQYKVRFKKG